MKVEGLPLGSSYTDDDQNNLKQLLEAFGSVVSLEDIASAYCETGRNIVSTAEMLRNMPSSNFRSSCSKSQVDLENTTDVSSGSSSNNTNSVKVKSKKCSASAGSVSDVIGRNYIRSRPQLNEKLKPVKLNSDDFPESAIWHEKKELASSTSRRESMDNDIGEFVYEMLGNVYKMDKSVIQDVISQCGYNIPMSMDKLLDLSAVTLEKSDDVIGLAARNTMKNGVDVRSVSCEKQSPFVKHSGSEDELVLPQTETKKKDIQREVLESLFTARDRSEEKQFTNSIRRDRQSPYGRIVSRPLEETVVEDFTFITRQAVSSQNAETNQESYEELRNAVRENWVIFKHYYIASVEAFMKGDYEMSQKLWEEGNLYLRKAREADKKSAEKIIEDSDGDEEYFMNLHVFEPRDALYQMKLHLTNLSGLPSVRYLKVAVGTDDCGDKKDGRRKRLITKLLEKEGISWSEEGNGWTICVRMDEIDPQKLSFAKDE